MTKNWVYNKFVKKNLLETLRRSDEYPFRFFVRFFLNVLRMITDNNLLSVRKVLLTRINSWTPGFSSLKVPIKSPVDLLFVVTDKDFQILPLAIDGGLLALNQHVVGSVVIVTPRKHLSELKSILPPNIPNLRLVCDEEVLDENLIQDLLEAFGARAGWFIQQVIKVQVIQLSSNIATLMIDADTVLVKDRIWIDESGVQILCPSEEFNPDYYSALRKIGLEPREDFSFVSHHMLIQTRILKEFFLQTGLSDSHHLVKHLIQKHTQQSLSPISLDYELYAQYMLSAHPDLVKIEKWSNIGIPRFQMDDQHRMEELMQTYSKKYASISFHSWM